MKKQRNHYTPEEKVTILRRQLLEKEPISKLCDELGLQPTVFYRWQKELFENGAAAFEQKARPNHSSDQERMREGYRRLTFMMLDADIVAVSPSSVWRVLSQAGLLSKWNGKSSKKGTGFAQPLAAHEHWHIDVSYLNIGGTFYYLCSILDGFSRYIVNWDIRESMTEADIEIILQAAKEKYPEVRPRIISDNGPQFIAKDFKEFIRISGMTHVRTSPFYPQSNGKIERWHKSLKGECIRPGTPLSLDDARRLVSGYVDHYNNVRLNSAVGYITPKDMLAGRQLEIQAERDRKLEAARKQRQIRRQQAA
jgi:putative transposase